MKVFFGCDSKSLLADRDRYLMIREGIINLGHTITRDWIPEFLEESDKGITEIKKEHYSRTVEAIMASDVVVVEGSVKSTAMGHIVTLSLQKSKPVLFLHYATEDASHSDIMHGIDDDLFVKREYTEENLPHILEDFLNNKGWGAKIRFNMFLDKELDSYLNWAAFTYSTNKTKVVKDAIRKEMQEDQGYDNYMRGK